MFAAAKSLVEKFSEEGLPTGKVAMMFNVGDQKFTSRDCWNHLRDVRGKNIDAGDALAVLNYCRKQQVKNSNFFYAIQCDDVGHVGNFFWWMQYFLGGCTVKNGLSILWGCGDI